MSITRDGDEQSEIADLFTDAADTEYLRKYDIQMTPFVEAFWRAAQASMRSETGAS